MSWHGPQGRGALRKRREKKRAEAELRNRQAPQLPRGDCSRKARFPTRDAAEAVLLSCKIARALRHNPKRRELRSYECRTHHCWHLTSKPDKYTQPVGQVA